MAEVQPFRGVHYNKRLIDDWPAVICPAYDIISPRLQEELYLRSEYNFIRLELGRELPQDTTSDNKYTRAAAAMEQWLRQGILEVDTEPAIYLHDHYFHHRERPHKRRGLTVLVRMAEWDKMVIRPHEGTLAEPKSDRLSLLWALQANTSPILALFADPGRHIATILTGQEASQPLFNLKEADGESHVVWAITEPKVIKQIAASLARQPLYIADGHHRYESALAYQRERRDFSATASENEASSFVMMTLVDFTDPGLVILPPHRLVRGIAKPTLDELMNRLKVFFEIEGLPLSMPGVWQQVDALLEETNEVRLLLFGLTMEHLFILRLRDPAAARQMMPYFHSELYNALDVSIVDHLILEKLLALNSDREESLLAYSYDRQDAINRVLVQEYQLAFLLNPVKATTVKAVADAGDKVPRKSTYFYPKAPAGLIFHQQV